jgi:DNA-binding response OmpR family regulator
MEVDAIRPDMIILDATMFKVSSYDISLLLRKQFSLKGTPIILVTKKNNLINKIITRLVGATACLTACLGKPFNQDELMKVIFEKIN